MVTRVAPRRNTARRLAAALDNRPGVLTDGRSPGPKVVADLLIALHVADLDGIHPPVCASCGKVLRVAARRGQTGAALPAWHPGGLRRHQDHQRP